MCSNILAELNCLNIKRKLKREQKATEYNVYYNIIEYASYSCSAPEHD